MSKKFLETIGCSKPLHFKDRLLMKHEMKGKTNLPLSLETQLQDSHWKHGTDYPITNSMLRYPEKQSGL